MDTTPHHPAPPRTPAPSDTPEPSGPISRAVRSVRNDVAILQAARDVFVADSEAPVSTVAHVAGVGSSALYHRYPTKAALLAALCLAGLHDHVHAAEVALAVDDPWEAFTGFVGTVVERDLHALTVGLAGQFPATTEHRDLSDEVDRLSSELVERASRAGVLRDDVVVEDLAMVYEQLRAVRVGTPNRTQTLRDRYLRLQLDGLRAGSNPDVLPGQPPTAAELAARWTVREIQ